MSLDFDGMAGNGVNRSSNKYAKNQWSGHSNDGRTVNMGRGPTKGNDGACGHAGYASPKGAPTSAGAQSDTKQYRGVGGTSVKKPGADAKVNYGRGPTKGNQCC